MAPLISSHRTRLPCITARFILVSFISRTTAWRADAFSVYSCCCSGVSGFPEGSR